MDFPELIDDTFHKLDHILRIDILLNIKLCCNDFEHMTRKIMFIDEMPTIYNKLNALNKNLNNIRLRLNKINPMFIDINWINIIDDGINMITIIKQQCSNMLNKLIATSTTFEDINNYYTHFTEKIYVLDKLRTELVEDGEAFYDDDEDTK